MSRHAPSKNEINAGSMRYISSMHEIRDNTNTRYKPEPSRVSLYCRLLRFFPTLSSLMAKSEEIAFSAVDIRGERMALLLFDFVCFLVGVITGEGGAE